MLSGLNSNFSILGNGTGYIAIDGDWVPINGNIPYLSYAPLVSHVLFSDLAAITTFNQNAESTTSLITSTAERIVRMHCEGHTTSGLYDLWAGEGRKGTSSTTLSQKLKNAGVRTSVYGHGSYTMQARPEEASDLETNYPLAIAGFNPGNPDSSRTLEMMQVDQDNNIDEANFEDTSIGNWRVGGPSGTTITRVNAGTASIGTTPHSGTHCLAVTRGATAGAMTATTGIAIGTSPTKRVTEGTRVRVSAYAKAQSTPRSCTAQLRWYSFQGSLISTTIGAANTDSTSAWTEYSAEATAPANSAFVTLIIQWTGPPASGETHYIDTVSMTYLSGKLESPISEGHFKVNGTWFVHQDFEADHQSLVNYALNRYSTAQGLSWRYKASTACDENGDLDVSDEGRLHQGVKWVRTFNTANDTDFKVALRPMFGMYVPQSVKDALPEWMLWSNNTVTPNIVDAIQPTWIQEITHDHDGLGTHTHQVGEPNDIFLIWFRKHWQQLVAYSEANPEVTFLHGGWFGGQYDEIAWFPEVSNVTSGPDFTAAHLGLMQIAYEETPFIYPIEWPITGHGGYNHLSDRDLINAVRLKAVDLYGGITQSKGRVYLSANGWMNTRIMGDTGTHEIAKQEDLMGIGSQDTTDDNRVMIQLQHIIGGGTLVDDWNVNYEWAMGDVVDVVPNRRTLKADDGSRLVGPIEVYLWQTVNDSAGANIYAPFLDELDTAVAAYSAVVAAEETVDESVITVWANHMHRPKTTISGVSLVTNEITLNNHGFANNTIVYFMSPGLPTPLSEETTYYVIDATTNTFKVSLTQGGSEVDITVAATAPWYVTLTNRSWPYLAPRGTDPEVTPATTSNNTSSVVHWIRVGDEIMGIKSVSTPSNGIIVLNVVRGMWRTNANSHASGAQVLSPVYVGSVSTGADATFAGSPIVNDNTKALRYVLALEQNIASNVTGNKLATEWLAKRRLMQYAEYDTAENPRSVPQDTSFNAWANYSDAANDITSVDSIYLDITGTDFYNQCDNHGYDVLPWSLTGVPSILEPNSLHTREALTAAQIAKTDDFRSFFSSVGSDIDFVIGNNLASQFNDSDPYRLEVIVSGALDTAVLEFWLNPPTGTFKLGAQRDQWMIICLNDYKATVWPKTSSNALAGGVFSTVSHYLRWTYGHFLLGWRRSNNQEFATEWGVDVSNIESYFSTPLGDPIENYDLWADIPELETGVKYKAFENGIVAVNTTNAPIEVTVDLTDPVVVTDDEEPVTSIYTIPAYDSAIFYVAAS